MRIWFTSKGLQLEKTKQDFKKIKNEDINIYYNTVVDIEDGLTLEEFLECLKPYFKTIDRDFVAFSRGASIFDYYQELKKEATDNPETTNIDCLEFGKNITIHTSYENEPLNSDDDLSEEDEKSISYLDDHLRLHGLIPDDNGEFVPHQLEFIPINDLKHLEIFINVDCIVSTITSKNFERDYEFTNVAMTTYHPTLFEILKTFILDIMYYGSPSDRDKACEDFKENVKNIPIIKNMEVVEFDLNESEYFDGRTNDEITLELLKKELLEEQEKENFHECFLILKDIKIIEARLKKK